MQGLPELGVKFCSPPRHARGLGLANLKVTGPGDALMIVYFMLLRA
jgi:hypothetical protein